LALITGCAAPVSACSRRSTLQPGQHGGAGLHYSVLELRYWLTRVFGGAHEVFAARHSTDTAPFALRACRSGKIRRGSIADLSLGGQWKPGEDRGS
jgi:hypothetical protein